ncbi:MAG: hypothetical protein PWQ77_1097 [Kosmotogales bacterium]|nr:hypothetical protein [Kosmotogales bacterium]
MNKGITIVETLITLCAISVISIGVLNLFVLYCEEVHFFNSYSKDICNLNRAVDFIKEDLKSNKRLLYQNKSSLYLLEYENPGYKVVSYYYKKGYLNRKKNGTVNKLYKVKKKFEIERVEQIIIFNIDDRKLYINMEE